MQRCDKENPYQLKAPPNTSEYEMDFDLKDGQEVVICTVGKATLLYNAGSVEDVVTMLKERGDWMDLDGADEQKEAKPGTLEAWGRSTENPVGGWYGLKKVYEGVLAFMSTADFTTERSRSFTGPHSTAP